MKRLFYSLILFLLFVPASPGTATAGITLLVGEPYGRFGFFNPTGHAAVYFSRICAETPTSLRLCKPGEPGAVISRYNRIGGFDWIAIPPLPYFYAVENAEMIPETAETGVVALLRDSYRRKHLRELAPDEPDKEIPSGDWIQLVGSAYDRSIYGFTLETTLEADKMLILHLNSLENRRKFNIFYRNCADFVRDILNFHYPGAIKRNIIGDLGIMSPKNTARSLVRYVDRHPELLLTTFTITQIPGGRSSAGLRGVSESLVRSWKYAIPLAIFQPWVAVSAAAGYVSTGRFNPRKYASITCDPGNIDECIKGVREIPNSLSAETAAKEPHGRLQVLLEFPPIPTGSDVFLPGKADTLTIDSPAGQAGVESDEIFSFRALTLKSAFHHLRETALIP
ncbi:MAG TPA: hypothetical protein VLL97_00930 [Acidobacteriota bacterium]|nr:hypothetical protein [Acidobacteriota bacterium]